MAMPKERRARLSIDVEPELHQRIKNAAAARGLSIREYVETILRRALEAEARADEIIVPRLTVEERERGLRALEELERLGQELLEQRGGELFSPSWELINEARDERTRELMQET
jgi:uncharacterized protein (DUF1778 family)